jgi:hypothetical protein
MNEGAVKSNLIRATEPSTSQIDFLIAKTSSKKFMHNADWWKSNEVTQQRAKRSF